MQEIHNKGMNSDWQKDSAFCQPVIPPFKHSGGFGKPKRVICKSLLRYRFQLAFNALRNAEYPSVSYEILSSFLGEFDKSIVPSGGWKGVAFRYMMRQNWIIRHEKSSSQGEVRHA